MEETAPHINKKDISKLARNHPVAVIVGAAGFLGSHLADHLLKLKIQVVGIDDLSCGKVENLNFAKENKDFHFYHSKIEDSEVKNVLKQLPRLDYAFFMAKNDESLTLLNLGLENFLEVVKNQHEMLVNEHRSHIEKPKVLFLSSIELYDNKRSASYELLETAEIFFAKFTKQNSLNARVVRLGEVFGPRMNLDRPEVFGRLIKASLEDNLATENPTQDFSTRGIYIDDAISLITKGMLLGASANKIFDGIQITPFKVEEIKQVLLDPKWYQESGFKFTQLPPWETPNLKRTVKELSWKPRTNIITALNETIQYFSKSPPSASRKIRIAEPEKIETESDVVEEAKENKPASVEGWSFKEIGEQEIEKNDSQKSIWPIFKFLVIWVIILLGLVYPFFVLVAGNFIIPNSLRRVESEVLIGDFKGAEQEISLGYLSAKEQDNIVSSLSFLKIFGLFNPQIDQWSNISNENVESFQNVQRTVSLVDQFVSNLEQGALTASSADQFNQTEGENEQNLADSVVKVASFNQTVLGKVDHQSLQNFYNILIGTKQAEQILPGLLSRQGSGTKQYLVILQNEQTVRPTGGIISGLVLVKVGNGKVIDISNLSLDDLDSKLPANLVPEDLIKTNLNIANLKLSNSNFDADYSTFAKTFEALYLQAGGVQVDGVMAVDAKSAGALTEDLGGITLDSGEQIATGGEAAALVNGADSPKKGQLLKQLMTKFFGVSRQSIFKVGQNLSDGLNQKDILVFVNDPELEKKFVNSGWSGALGGQKNSDNNINDLVATELYDFNGSSALKKEFGDQITIDEQGVIQHNLTVSFTEEGNRAFEAEIMVYLPVGVKINKVILGNSDLTAKTNPFIKYGLSGISLPLSVKPGDSQSLILAYQLPSGLNLGQGSSGYKYQFLKQAGTDSDPLNVTFNYPDDLKVSDNLNPNDGLVSGGQIQTNLLEDRLFQLTFTK